MKAGSTAAAAVDPSLVVALSPNSPIPPGANAIGSVSLNTALPSGNNNIGDVDIVTTPGLLTADVTIKAASTASVAADKSLVTALSPNTPLPVGANAIGSVAINAALPAGGNAIGTVAINAALPAGTNLLGKIEVSNQKTLKTLKIDVAAVGDNVIVALVAGKRIKVTAYTLQSKGTVDVKLVNGAAGTDLTGAFSFQAREGLALATAAPGFLMATTAGIALYLNLSLAIQVVGFVTYFDDDAT